ncbi:hypothetical protein [Microcoleus sp.]|uniref:hypothetical protein n=1 Tax=Microcoleus sp. TaxID=44472 RepID=UPI0035936C0D
MARNHHKVDVFIIKLLSFFNKRIYARADTGIYWIVNLVEGLVEMYDRPSGNTAQPDNDRRLNYGISSAVPVTFDRVEMQGKRI